MMERAEVQLIAHISFIPELPRWEVRRSRLAVLDNILGGGYFGLVKEGIFLKSDTSDDENQKIPVAVKTLKGTAIKSTSSSN